MSNLIQITDTESKVSIVPETYPGTDEIQQPLKRSNPYPIDASSVFNSMDALVAYMKTPTAYVGQMVSVVENNEAKAYIIKSTTEAVEIGAVDTSEGTTEGIDKEELDSTISDLVLSKESETGKTVRTVAQEIASDYCNDAINSIDDKVTDLQTTVGTLPEDYDNIIDYVDATHESVRDTSTVSGGNRYGIYYEDEHLNIDSRNTIEMSFLADTSSYEDTVVYATYTNSAKTNTKIVLEKSDPRESFEISQGADDWRIASWSIKSTHSDYIEDGTNTKYFLFKDAGLYTSQYEDTSASGSWRLQWHPYTLSALGTLNYLKIAGKLEYVVGNVVEIAKTYDNSNSNIDASSCENNNACAVIGDHIVSFELCHIEESEQGDAFDYIKATVALDTKEMSIRGTTTQGFYDGFVFYFVEPKYRHRMTSSSPGAPAGSSAWIYPITTDLSDTSAIWTPTFCNNYVHQFIIYKDPEGRYFSVSAGTTTNPLASAPTKIINNIFDKGGQFYRIVNNNTLKPIIVETDRKALQTSVNTYNMFTGNDLLIPHATPVLYPAVNTGKFFGVDPNNEWVIEDDLGAFSYNYTQKLGYVSDSKQLQLKRVNPAGTYQIMKLEGQGRLYLDNGDIMVVPEVWCRGTYNDLHPEIVGLPGACKLYTQLLKIDRWKQATREEIAKFDAAHPGCDYFRSYTASDTDSLGNAFGTAHNVAWEQGKTRIFYRTLTNQQGTITGTLYKDGIPFENSTYSGVKNWSALHEIITSENIDAKIDELVPSIVNQTISENTDIVLQDKLTAAIQSHTHLNYATQEDLGNAINGCISGSKIGTELSDRFYTVEYSGTLEPTASMISAGFGSFNIKLVFLAFNNNTYSSLLSDQANLNDVLVRQFITNGMIVLKTGYMTGTGTDVNLNSYIDKVSLDGSTWSFYAYPLGIAAVAEGTFKTGKFSLETHTP